MKKNLSDDRDGICQAVREAVKAARICFITILRKNLKKRSHRDPDDKKVHAYFLASVNSGKFQEFAAQNILDLLQDYESCLDKSFNDWSLEERNEASLFVERYFLLLAKALNRTRGRPRKQKKKMREVSF